MSNPTAQELILKTKKGDTSGILPPLLSLKCQLCGDYLKAPVTLPCLHSFCKGCLEKYNQEQLLKIKRQQVEPERPRHEFENDFRAPAKEKNAEPEMFTVQCPTCIEVLRLTPTNEPQVPFDNLRLARIVDMVRGSRVLCQNCSDAPSEILCKTCDAWLCLNCFQDTHSAPIFKTHLTEGLTHSEMFALPKCEVHPTNELEFFSTEDEVGVCQVCLLKGDFVGKPYCLVSDVRKMRQSEIEKGVRIVIEEKERLLVGRQEMEQVNDELIRTLEEQTNNVKENFASIREALDLREKETLKALDKLKDTKAQVLDQQISQTDHIMSVINDGVRNVKLILNHSNDLELVYFTIVLQEFVADLAKMKAPDFSGEETKPLSFFHTPAVDGDLPVVLSDKIADLVSAYAVVPDAKFETPKSKTGENLKSPKKLVLQQPRLTTTQQNILQEVGAEDKADEYGCIVQ